MGSLMDLSCSTVPLSLFVTRVSHVFFIPFHSTTKLPDWVIFTCLSISLLVSDSVWLTPHDQCHVHWVYLSDCPAGVIVWHGFTWEPPPTLA